MLEDGAHRETEAIGDRQPFLIERFQEPPDIRGDVLPLAPDFALLHAGHVAKGDAHVVLRVEVGKGNRQQPVPLHEPIPKEPPAHAQPFLGATLGYRRDVDFRPDGVDPDAGRVRVRVLAGGQRGRAPCDDRWRHAVAVFPGQYVLAA